MKVGARKSLPVLEALPAAGAALHIGSDGLSGADNSSDQRPKPAKSVRRTPYTHSYWIFVYNSGPYHRRRIASQRATLSKLINDADT